MRVLSILLFVTLSVLLSGCGGSTGSSSSSTPSSSSSIASSSSSKSSSLSSAASSVASSSALVLSSELDRHVKQLMQESGATAATVAIAKNDQILYEQAYGFLDANKTIAAKTDTLMRIASVTKPVTAAMVRKLAASGVLTLSDHVFCTGNNAPCWLPANLLSATSDSRAKDITIQQLIAHQGGWYQDVSGDPLNQEFEIKTLLQLSGPPTREDIVRHVMKRPLDFTPGAPDYVHRNYTNFGYLLLGMVIEQATLTDYTKYVQMEIMAQLGVSASDFKTAATPLLEHDAREPIYLFAEMCPSVFANRMALCSEEGADLKNWVAPGGIITTARAMALFAQDYRLPPDYGSGYGVIGEPLGSATYSGSHGGSGPGTSTMVRQLPSGVSYAVFLNASYDIEPKLAELDRVSQLTP